MWLIIIFNTSNLWNLVLCFNTWILVSGCRGIDLSRWRELLKENGEVADLEKFAHYVHGNHFIPNTVLVDCTADSIIASHYHDWLRKGIHVITPNKKANSGPLDQVRLILAYLLVKSTSLDKHIFGVLVIS